MKGMVGDVDVETLSPTGYQNVWTYVPDLGLRS